MHPRIQLLLGSFLLLGTLPVQAQSPPATPDAAPETVPAVPPRGLSLSEALQRPIASVDEQGRGWARVRRMRASLDSHGLSVYPVLGRKVEREAPLHFRTSATLGGSPLDLSPASATSASREHLSLQRAALREVVHLEADSIEQTFVFEELSGSGDLVVRLDVTTDLEVCVEGDTLRFLHPNGSEVQYGQAFVFDAGGCKRSIERTWKDGGIELRVPASYLETAVLPVVIDPPITFFSSDFGNTDDASPDIVFAGRPNRYLVCWEEFTSQSNSDVYLTWFSSSGNVQGASIAIEQGPQNWENPRIAYCYGPDRALVVASTDLGSGLSTVRGRLVDATDMTTVGDSFAISSSGSDKIDVDVGGSNFPTSAFSNFTVTWCFHQGSGYSQAQYRTVRHDGASVTGIEALSSFDEGALHTTISNSLGDTSSPGRFWTVAWTRDPDGNKRGQIMARCISWTGNLLSGAAGEAFVVDGSANASYPTVTSLFDDPLVLNGERPSIVAYHRRHVDGSHPHGGQSNVYGVVTTPGQAHGLVPLSAGRESITTDLNQLRPSIATDGRGFSLAYQEEYFDQIGTGAWATYMMSGNIVERDGQLDLALSERHRPLGTSGETDAQVRLTTVREGELSTTSDDGAAIWVQSWNIVGGYGQLRGAIFDNPTWDQSSERAIGIQYCQPNPNATGTFGGRGNSWLRIIGEGDVNSPLIVQASDLPLNQTGILLMSQHTGDAPVFGSQGRLCVSAPIARFLGAHNSGLSGQINLMVNPAALPSATGPVAALPGETYYFQVWHREVVVDLPTSNLTIGCKVTFLP